MKKPRVVFFVLLIVLLFNSCKVQNNEETFTDAYYCFIDSVGEKVVLKQKPTKVAVLFSSLAELWLSAGGNISVTVGETEERGFITSNTISQEQIILVDDSAGKVINNEILLSAEPDFVICSADIAAQKETAKLLRTLNIPVAEFRLESFEDYMQIMKHCTNITQNPDKYNELADNQHKKIQKIKSIIQEVKKEDTKKILFIRAGSTSQSTKAKTSKDNFTCAMLKELGTYNIAENAPVLLDGLSFEEILKENPDFIFFSFMGKEEAAKAYTKDLIESDLWQSLTAIKQNNYAFLPKDLFHYKPNSRWAEAYQYLAKLLYPEVDFN